MLDVVIEKRRRTWEWRVVGASGQTIMSGRESSRRVARYQARGRCFCYWLIPDGTTKTPGEKDSMKFTADRPLSDPDKAARKLVEIANTVEAVQDGRIHIELINAPFLQGGGSLLGYKAGLERAITKGWLTIHRSGVYVKFTEAGAELFA
jgi:hypothetical protein